MIERRFFDRIDVDTEGIIFDMKGNEINCGLINISENGVCVVYPQKSIPKEAELETGRDYKLQFIDTLYIKQRKRIKDYVVSCEITVKNIRTTDGLVHAGCRVIFSSEEYRTYINEVRRNKL